MEKFPITQKGYELLEQEIKHLKYVERPAVITAISTAREFGDLSENAEYDSAREKQSFIEGRILELEDKFSRAEVIDITKLVPDSIKFGATVHLLDDDTEQECVYHITGEYEADSKQNKISTKSPVARALIGKTVGEVAEVTTPKGKKVFEILKITFEDL
jgi:transcription elongation factor GreA